MYYYRPSQQKGIAAKPPRSRKNTGRRVSRGRKTVIKPPRRRSGFARCLKVLLVIVLILALSVSALYFLPVGVFSSHDKNTYAAYEKLPKGYTHVLLIGLDVNSSDTSRSDTMMILSVGKGNLFLTSLQRDTGVYIEGYKGLQRLNAAYAYGGAELLLRTVNRNFGLDITRYALVDYESFPKLIDIMGGLDVTDISAAEAEQINKNMYDVLRRRYKKGSLSESAAAELFEKEFLLRSGDLHLSGLQALGYARIRVLDSDYGRTNRQRRLIKAAFERFKQLKADPAALIKLGIAGIDAVKTNMGPLEIISLAEKAALSDFKNQTRLPVNGTYTDEGGMFYNVDYNANHAAFVSFIYGS